MKHDGESLLLEVGVHSVLLRMSLVYHALTGLAKADQLKPDSGGVDLTGDEVM